MREFETLILLNLQLNQNPLLFSRELWEKSRKFQEFNPCWFLSESSWVSFSRQEFEEKPDEHAD